MNENMYIKVGVSDNNEYDKTMFCVRTYVDAHPVAKKLVEDFDDAMELAYKLAGDDGSKVVVNIRATRRAKQIILQNLREKKERKTAPRSLVGGE
jgi:hypothetical protein